MKKHMPLKGKLNLLLTSIMIPLVLLVIYLIVSLVDFGTAYNRIVKNISIASGYNFTFREDVNYIVYCSVINEKTYGELVLTESQGDFSGDRLKDPYETIRRARKSFQALLESTKETGNKKSVESLTWILKWMDRLEDAVGQIDENVQNDAPPQDNDKLYNNTVVILTEMIQETIQQYIQDEAAEMETVRLGLERRQNQAVTISVYALILIFGFSLVISRKITLGVTRPIKELCRATEEVGRGDFSSPTRIEAGDEIQTLTGSFNQMKVKIGELIEDVRKEQNNLRATELKLLQAQINPHFLYNTLDAIIWLAESGKTDQVVSMVTSLSEFFRTVLSEGKDFITVREEISHVRSYLSIQQFRYQDILEYEIDVEGGMDSFLILKLTLQPIVENALYHGIKNKRGMGFIRVEGKVEGERVLFRVEDNGIGMSSDRLEELKRSVKSRSQEGGGGFGLANVDERVRMTYGEEYGLSFESALGEGTAVTVTLPLTCQ